MADESTEPLSDSPDILEQLENASNMLVKASAFDGGTGKACVDLLGVAPAGELNVLVVSYNQSAERWLTRFQRHAQSMPQNMVVVSVGEAMRSATTSTTGSGGRPLAPGEPVLDTVGSPADLTGLGIKITEYLREFEDARYAVGPSSTTLCFDSLTALLQYADVERVFRFLHAITTWMTQSNVIAHYHIDPRAHDAKTVATLEPLFDATLDVTAGPDTDDWILHTD